MKLHDLAIEHSAEELREIQDRRQYTIKRFLYIQEQLNHLGKQYRQDLGEDFYQKLCHTFLITNGQRYFSEKWPDSPSLFSYQDKYYYGYSLWFLSEKSHIMDNVYIIVPSEQAKDMKALISELHKMYSNLQQQKKLIPKYKTTLNHMKAKALQNETK